MIRRCITHLVAAFSLVLAACGGGSDGGSPVPTSTPPASAGSTTVYAVPAPESLSVADVQQVLAQAVAQASADGRPAVISVVDRVGNVLALFRMNGAPATAHIADAPDGRNADVQGLDVPAEASAIAKAVTGAYLSSGGNAFSTRTASEIVQTRFPPTAATTGLGSGPLFGVQFSQLPCSDLSARFAAAGGAGALIGPKRSPLGLSADPGGFPLYKNGVVVGGIGVEADGVYGADPDVQQTNLIVDERIALAGTLGYAAPATITADQITVAGVKLIYSDVAYAGLAATTGASFASQGARGALEALTGYTAGAIGAGTAYGTEASGIRASTAAEFPNGDAFVLSDGAGNDRYPVRGGTDAGDVATPLSAAEVRTILAQAFAVMSHARAQIRNPLSSIAQVSIAVVDTHGVPLGIVRAPDAPIFGIDVSLQKGRTAAFLSNPAAGSDLLAAGGEAPGFVAAARGFLGDQTALSGKYAFTDRAGGDLSRPTFPDGSVGRANGPFSRPADQFNPFSTGLQSALIVGNLAQHLAYAAGASPTDTPRRCTTVPDAAPGQNRIQNGIQIFPGSVPIYRGGVLVGGLGVSGDGIDQDDMISFLGLANAGQALGASGIGNAPAAIRADTIVVMLADGASARLRYVSCPQAPFVDSNTQNVCQGL